MSSDDQKADRANELIDKLAAKKRRAKLEGEETHQPSYSPPAKDDKAAIPGDFRVAQAYMGAKTNEESTGCIIDTDNQDEPELPSGFIAGADVFASQSDANASGPIPAGVDDSTATESPFLTPPKGTRAPDGIQEEDEPSDAFLDLFSRKNDSSSARNSAKVKYEPIVNIPSPISEDETVRLKNKEPRAGEVAIKQEKPDMPASAQDTGEFESEGGSTSDETAFHPGPAALHAPTIDAPAPNSASGSKIRKGKAEDLPNEIGVSGFKEVKFIAMGAEGAVYQATNELMDSATALKFLRGYDESKLERFAKEAAVIRSLDSIPNVVRVYNFAWGEISFKDEQGSKRKVRIPYLEQGLMHRSLQERLDNGEVLTLKETVNKGVDISRALQKIHDKGVIHRDLKPANILEDKDGVAHIADLGLALVRDTGQAQQEQGNIAGTPHYMSPEQASGDVDQVDNRSDVYGLGAVLYRLLTGEVPQFSDSTGKSIKLKGKNVFEIVKIVSSFNVTPLRKVRKDTPRDLADIVEKAMSKERWARYACADDLADDLERYKNGIPPEASTKWLPVRFIQHLYARKVKTAAGIALIAASAYGSDLYEKTKQVEEKMGRIRQIAQVELDEAQKMHEESVSSNDAAAVSSAIIQYDEAVSSFEQLSGLDNDSTIAEQIAELKRSKGELERLVSRLERAQIVQEQERELESLFGDAQERYDEFRHESPQDQITHIDSMIETLARVRDEAVKVESEAGEQRVLSIDRLIVQANSVVSAARVENERSELAETAQQRYDSAFLLFREVSERNILDQYERTRSALNQALVSASEWDRKDADNTLPDNMIASLERTIGELDRLHGSVQDSTQRAVKAQGLAEMAQRELDEHDYAAARQHFTEAENLSSTPDIKQMLDHVVQLHERYQIERVQHAYESSFDYQKQVTNIWTEYYRARIRSSVRDERLRQARESLEEQLERPARDGEVRAELSHIALDRAYFDRFTDTQTRLAEESTRLVVDTNRAQQIRRDIERRDAVWSELQGVNEAYVRGAITREEYELRSGPLTRELRGE